MTAVAMPDTASSVESELVGFARSLRWSALPDEVRSTVRRLAGDAVGNALAGSTASDVPQLRAAALQLYGPGEATVLGGEPTSLVGAAGLNAFQTTAHTMCDVYRPALCHVTPEVVPAALAVAEHVDADGERVMTAIAVGMEATTRICDALGYTSFRRRGWHSPGIAGALGAALSVGLLLDLDESGLAGCLGLAGDQAAGSFAAVGTIGVKFHQVSGARAAVTAGFHALQGLRGSARILTASDGGLLRAFSDAPEPRRLVGGLGKHWRLTAIAMRPYPAASTLQGMIDCLLVAHTNHPGLVGDLHRATIYLSCEGYRLGAHHDWGSELRAMQSAFFVAAAVVASGHCWLDLYDHEHRGDPVISAIAREKVVVCEDAGLPDGAARVELDVDGERVVLERRTAIGDPDDPVPDGLLADKVARCLETVRLPIEAGVTTARLLAIDDESSIRGLLAELRAGRSEDGGSR